MESLGVQAYNPHLKKVLQSFQSASMNSLSGPERYVAAWGDPAKLSPTELEEYRKHFIATVSLKKEATDPALAYTTVGRTVATPLAPVLIPMDNR